MFAGESNFAYLEPDTLVGYRILALTAVAYIRSKSGFWMSAEYREMLTFWERIAKKNKNSEPLPNYQSNIKSY